jgi:hypothetical protein
MHVIDEFELVYNDFKTFANVVHQTPNFSTKMDPKATYFLRYISWIINA